MLIVYQYLTAMVNRKSLFYRHCLVADYSFIKNLVGSLDRLAKTASSRDSVDLIMCTPSNVRIIVVYKTTKCNHLVTMK